jgi:hypothetical protein
MLKGGYAFHIAAAGTLVACGGFGVIRCVCAGADASDCAQSTPPGELAGIRAAAERFLRALDDLDWEAFRASWVSEPTVFSHLLIRLTV